MQKNPRKLEEIPRVVMTLRNLGMSDDKKSQRKPRQKCNESNKDEGICSD